MARVRLRITIFNVDGVSNLLFVLLPDIVAFLKEREDRVWMISLLEYFRGIISGVKKMDPTFPLVMDGEPARYSSLAHHGLCMRGRPPLVEVGRHRLSVLIHASLMMRVVAPVLLLFNLTPRDRRTRSAGVLCTHLGLVNKWEYRGGGR